MIQHQVITKACESIVNGTACTKIEEFTSKLQLACALQ